jgi:uncharacterized protein
MERKIRRSDRAISENEARGILERGEYGILSTVSADGQPYGVPVSYACSEEAIYFHCAQTGHKLENLSANNRVSFCVVGPTELVPEEFGTKYESVIVVGKAFEASESEQRQGLLGLIEKYAPEFLEKGQQHIADDRGKTKVYKIVIEAITGKARK